MSEDPDAAARLREAVANEDREALDTAVTNLQTASLQDLLDDLLAAIEEDRYEDARTLLNQLISRYEEQRPTENEIFARVQAVRTGPKADFQTVQNLTDYVRTTTETRTQRSVLLSGIAAYIESQGAQVGKSEAKQIVQESKTQEQEFTNQTDQVKSNLSDVAVPAEIAVTQLSLAAESLQKGAPSTLSVTVSNVGDQDASQVGLRIETPDGLTVDQAAFDLGTVAGGSSLTRTVSLTGTNTGTQTLTARATSKNGGQAQESLTLNVVSPGPSLSPVVGSNQPKDPDGDGVYEDVNGDGTVNIADVQALFANRNSEVIQNNPKAFDMNDDGTFNIADVQALFSQVISN